VSWEWLRESVVLAIHSEQLAEHGGRCGVRDAGLLASALARPPRHLAEYGSPGVYDLAAAYAFGLIRNHPFFDGNKRTGFLAAFVFLDRHGQVLQAREVEVAAAVTALAADGMTEAGFAAWLAERCAASDKG